MGMTDKQFNAFLRLVVDNVMQIKKEALINETSDNVLNQIDKLIELLDECMKD